MSMTNEQIDAATLDECRDEIAKLQGWRTLPPRNFAWWHDITRTGSSKHPIPATLDAIAGAMPDGWYIGIEHAYADRSDSWFVTAVNRTIPDTEQRHEMVGPTELLARARLLVKVLQAVTPPVV